MSTSVGNLSPAELAASLERGQVLHYPASPLALPSGEDLEFLLAQSPARFGHHEISYDPALRHVFGYARSTDREATARLIEILAGFSQSVTRWIDRVLPVYQGGLRLDRVSFHPLEEATRRLKTSARHDLLHIDASPDRPTRGDRILHVYANINPSEPRVWITSDPFASLLQRYGMAAGLPGSTSPGVLSRMQEGIRRMIQPSATPSSSYDSFMQRFHGFLKRNDAFHMHAAKTVWHFQPGAVWMVMTDACSHAVLRGRYVLEHSYLVSRECLVCPEEAPIALLERFCDSVESSPRTAA